MNVVSKIKMAVVGLNFGRYIIENELVGGAGAAYFELAALCDMEATKLADISRQTGVPGYDSLAALLNQRPDIQAIGLFTGPNGRADLLRQIIATGRDIMTTKPFELDPVATRDVLAEIRCAGRVLHLNSPAPLPSPDIRAMLDFRDTMDMGRLVQARFENWNRYDEHPDGSWYDSEEKCPLAPVFRIGIYGINDILYFARDPACVHTMGARLFTGRPTPDTGLLTVRFKDGALATVFSTLCANPGSAYPARLELLYERGLIVRAGSVSAAGESGTILIEASSKSRAGKVVVERVQVPRSTASGTYMWAEFHEAIRLRRGLDRELEAHILEGVRVLEAMKRAHLSGRMESVMDVLK